MHGLVEDTLIANIQKFGKIKRQLYKCSRECNQFESSSEDKKQTSRRIETLGMNPRYEGRRRGGIRSNYDPNIVMFDLKCGGDKYQGARDILEIKVN